MNFSIKRDARGGRFSKATITKSGKVETKSFPDGRHMVTERSFDHAKSAANSSLKSVEAK